jgi:hypothetical protein
MQKDTTTGPSSTIRGAINSFTDDPAVEQHHELEANGVLRTSEMFLSQGRLDCRRNPSMLSHLQQLMDTSILSTMTAASSFHYHLS